jgi:hypothetical protein
MTTHSENGYTLSESALFPRLMVLTMAVCMTHAVLTKPTETIWVQGFVVVLIVFCFWLALWQMEDTEVILDSSTRQITWHHRAWCQQSSGQLPYDQVKAVTILQHRDSDNVLFMNYQIAFVLKNGEHFLLHKQYKHDKPVTIAADISHQLNVPLYSG